MNNPFATSLEFLVDAGVTLATQAEPNNRFKLPAHVIPSEAEGSSPQTVKADSSITLRSTRNDKSLTSHADIIQQAEELAKNAQNLEDLKAAIQGFDGLSVKKTATQIVFADGNPNAKIMVVGEAPGADEDRQGKPFVGVSGQLLDKIFACIGLARDAEDAGKAIYISNILNWRPPGNRTPTAEEMTIAHPFIKRHIELIKPQYLILCGGVAAQTLLQSSESISRLRGRVHEMAGGVKAIATYHPAFLLRTPLQKKKVWEDMLLLQDHLNG